MDGTHFFVAVNEVKTGRLGSFGRRDPCLAALLMAMMEIEEGAAHSDKNHLHSISQA